MENDNMDFQICDVEYGIVLSHDLTMAEITAEVIFNATRNQTLVACVKIDNMEMIPSFRVPAQVGGNRVKIKPFRIFNPRIRQNGDPEDIKIYEMELILGNSEDNFLAHTGKLTITPECATVAK